MTPPHNHQPFMLPTCVQYLTEPALGDSMHTSCDIAPTPSYVIFTWFVRKALQCHAQLDTIKPALTYTHTSHSTLTWSTVKYD